MSAIQNEIEQALQPLVREVSALRGEIQALKGEDDSLLSTSEAATLLRCCEATLRRRVKEGRIACIRLGGSKMMFDRKALSDFRNNDSDSK